MARDGDARKSGARWWRWGCWVLVALVGAVAFLGARLTVDPSPSGFWPGAIAFDPVHDRVYVANDLTNAIGVFDGETLALIQTIDALRPVDPYRIGYGALVVDGTGERLFVVDTSKLTVRSLRLADRKEVARIEASDRPADEDVLCQATSAAFDTLRDRLLVLDGCSHRIQVYESRDLHRLTSFDLPESGRQSAVAFDRGSDQILVAAQDGKIQIFGGGTFAPVSTLDLLGIDPSALTGSGLGVGPIGVDADTRTLAAIGPKPNLVRVFDLHLGAVRKTLGAGTNSNSTDNAHLGSATGLAFDPRRGRILVADRLNPVVQVFDEGSLRRVGTIGSPRYSHGPIRACMANHYWPGAIDLDPAVERDVVVAKRFGEICGRLAIEASFDAGPGKTVYACSVYHWRDSRLHGAVDVDPKLRELLPRYEPLAEGAGGLAATRLMSGWGSVLLFVTDQHGEVTDLMEQPAELSRLRITSAAGAADLLQLTRLDPNVETACDATARVDAIPGGWMFWRVHRNCNPVPNNFFVGSWGKAIDLPSVGGGSEAGCAMVD